MSPTGTQGPKLDDSDGELREQRVSRAPAPIPERVPVTGVTPGTTHESKPSPLDRVVARLTAPVSILCTLPLLTLLVGAGNTALTYIRFRAHDRANALSLAAERSARAQIDIRRAFLAADQLLDRVRDLARERRDLRPSSKIAESLHDLAFERAGLRWLSISFPDGTFEGVVRQSDGEWRYQHSQVGPDGATSMRQFKVGGPDLAPISQANFHYDPRERSYYREALIRKRRFWTAPYTFYPDFRTGITRAEAVFDQDGSPKHVITADFDASGLSDVLGTSATNGAQIALFSDAGVVLALSGVSPTLWSRPGSSDAALTFSDLALPELAAFYSTRTAPHPPSIRQFRAAGAPFSAFESRLSVDAELHWNLVTILPEATLLQSAELQARHELWISAAVVGLGTAVALVVALGVRRLRRARERAEQKALRAMDRLEELGAYTLIEPLGQGGMGTVFLARHRLLARPAAIKLIRPDLSAEQRAKFEARFDIEARLLAKMRSPHTVTLLDYGSALDGRLYLVMELLVGMPLDRLVIEHGPQPAARVIPILLGVCRSLSEAHAAGLVHRDIKPANLFLCHDAEGIEMAKVIDFGLAKSSRRSDDTHTNIAGTPHYMAPEQASGGVVDARADLYALGCTAFFLLTGRNVFDEPTDLAVVLAHQMKEPPSLADVAKSYIPPELAALIQRCLAKDPAYRPVSAAAMARALTEMQLHAELEPSMPDSVAWWRARAKPSDLNPTLTT